LVNSADTSGILQLQTASTAALTIDASQNVGVGTSSPSVKLDVSGSVRFGATSSNRILYLGQSSPADNGAGSLEFQVSNTVKNWAIRTNNNVAGALEFCPSTASGGTTYTTPSMLIDSSGRVLVGLTSPNTSGANFQVSSGVTFPATQSASSDANTLDDYEEGTWTPTYYGSSTAGTTTYTNQRGTYTKVGRLVTIECDLTWTAKTGTGNGRVGGLPFTPAFPIDSRGLFLIAAYNGYSITSNYLTGLVEQNSAFIVLYTLSSSGTLADSAVTTGEIRFQMSYIAS
jgi:hypothetical protein